MTDEDIRIVECERCGGSGVAYIPDGPVTAVLCPSCNGVGEYTIEVQPVTIDDLEEMYRD